MPDIREQMISGGILSPVSEMHLLVVSSIIIMNDPQKHRLQI